MNTTAALIGVFGIIIAMLCAMGAAYYSGRKPEIVSDDLEYLEHLAREHEQGIEDNRKAILWLIRMIENNYTLSAAQTARLERVRRMLRETAGQGNRKQVMNEQTANSLKFEMKNGTSKNKF